MLTRRDFLKKCRNISLLMCGSTLLTRSLAEGFIRLTNDLPPIAFIHGQNCMACTTSMMYGNDFDFVDFLTHIGRLDLHPALSFSQGQGYLETLKSITGAGGHILVVEGTIPSRPREACFLGDQPLYNVLADHVRKARLVIGSGSCASHGGIPASNGNRTGALSVMAYLKQMKLDVPLLQLPGCPVHPDHLMGSIAYLAATGKLPPLKKQTRLPEEYYGETLHNRCSRYQHFTQDVFVEDFSREKKGCLLKKGCRGPITDSDCSVRRWNKRTSVCVESNTPCIGCMSPMWPFKTGLYLETKDVEDLPWSQIKLKTKNRRD